MRIHSISIILLLIIFLVGCDNEIIDNATDFDIKTINKESNEINLIGTVRYRLTSRLDKKFIKKYGRQYKDSLFAPVVLSLSNETFKEYSAAEIYNYKRDEIEQKLEEKAKTTFKQFEIELTSLSIWSVKLSDTLMQRLENEHLERLRKAKK